MSLKQSGAKKAVVLLSGGLDSATALYLARSKGFDCYCLFFEYGQRHRREMESARQIARAAGAHYQSLRVSFPWKGSALLDSRIKIPPATSSGPKAADAIPVTYVPARNIVFLSYALSYAEAIGAGAVFIGAHAQDYSGYPDCRPEFFRAFAKVSRAGLKASVEGRTIRIVTPLLHKRKSAIIRLGMRLGVPFADTWSCYRGGRRPCGRCESCYYRAKGFQEAGVVDPALSR